MTGIGSALTIVLGMAAAILFVIALAVFGGYLGAANLYGGLSAQNFAVYAILAAIGAIGAGEWDAQAGRR